MPQKSQNVFAEQETVARKEDKIDFAGGMVSTGLMVQLLLTHILAAGVGLGTFSLALHFFPQAAIVLAIGVGGLVGLALTTNIQYLVHIVELAVTDMVEKRAVGALGNFWSWPLTSLFLQLRRLNQHVQRRGVQEQAELILREQLLRQASEAAALEERNRIARDLHDSIKQQIFSIRMSAAAALAQQQKESEESREAIKDIQQSAKEAQVEMQALLQQLRAAPLEHVSLQEALRTQSQALGYRTGAEVMVDMAELPSSDRLLPGTQESIFRIVQEAFANIARHARAEKVWVRLVQTGEALEIEIRDNGQGFDPESGRAGMGIANMRERVQGLKGSFALKSAPGEGTEHLIRIPLVQPLQHVQEQERAAFELQTLKGQAAQGYQLADNVTQIAICLVIINNFVIVSLAVFAVCLFVILYGMIQGHYYKARLILRTEKGNPEVIRLHRSEANVVQILLALIIFSAWYLFFYLKSWEHISSGAWHIPYGSLFFLVFMAGFLGLEVFLRWRFYRIEDTFFGVVPRQEALIELEYKRRRNISRWRIWLVIAIFFILANRFVFVIPPTAIAQWSSYAVLLGMVGSAVIFWSDRLHITSWKKRLAH